MHRNGIFNDYLLYLKKRSLPLIEWMAWHDALAAEKFHK